MFTFDENLLNRVRNMDYQVAFEEFLQVAQMHQTYQEGHLRNMVRNYLYLTDIKDPQVARANTLSVYSKIAFELMSLSFPEKALHWFDHKFKIVGIENLEEALKESKFGVLILYQHLGILTMIIPAVIFALQEVLGKNKLEICAINKASEDETNAIREFFTVFKKLREVQNNIFLSSKTTMEYIPLMMKRNLLKGGISFISNDVNFVDSRFRAVFLKRKMSVGWGAAWVGQSVDTLVLPTNLLFKGSQNLELIFKKPIKLNREDGLEYNIYRLLRVAEDNILENLTQWLYLDRLHRWGNEWVGVGK